MASIIIILVLIALNFYFSIAEIGLISIDKTLLQQQADSGNKKAVSVLNLIKDPDEFLSAVQVGITLVGILEGLYGGDLMAAWLEPVFVSWGLHTSMAHLAALIMGVGSITYLTIVIGELIPKTLALLDPMKVSYLITPSMIIFSKITYPFIKLLTASTKFILGLFSVNTIREEKLTENDIRGMLTAAYKQGLIDKGELILHKNLFSSYDLTAENIMTPASMITYVREEMSREEITETIKRSIHRTFPVTGSTREVMGALGVREFFLYPEKRVPELLNAVSFLSVNQEVYDIFQQLRREGTNMGVVINEYGECEGIISYHDIVSGLLGGSLPGFNATERYLVQQPDKSWLTYGYTRLSYIRETLNFEWLREYEKEDITIAGLLIDKLRHIPVPGEKVMLNQVSFEIKKMDHHRIDEVIIRTQTLAQS
ncbi:hemolysin family protein [Chitinophaga arvensicola]|uniref:Putative hemolysin n=1 Tax=Chitinophaga arvensicola TaxID=29529 RepID=A0A1I0S527_9BACT|nr:hemolysin family protein [Chitinophaga arvensicola]SEW49929.1 putative hemolysin [Chitinophaga arvensicola]